MSGCLIGPKTWDRIVGICEPVLDSVGTVLGGCVIIYAINYVLVCMRQVMAMVFGFTKWNRCLMSGLPTNSPLLGFGTAKKVSVCMNWIKNVHVLLA